MSKQLIVRLISSKDHDMSKAELIKLVRETGSDRYDKNRKQMFDDFYGKHNIDFFGTIVEEAKLDDYIAEMEHEFGTKTLGDRKRRVEPDIAIMYNASNCNMVQHVYEDRLTSDCFQFISSPKEALEEVREL